LLQWSDFAVDQQRFVRSVGRRAGGHQHGQPADSHQRLQQAVTGFITRSRAESQARTGTGKKVTAAEFFGRRYLFNFFC
jgi:hypothetical protein